MQQKKIALQAKGIHKTFYSPVFLPIIKGVDLIAYHGEAIAITGRSGEGKSTLINLLGTLENPCQGTLEIASQTVTRRNKSHIRNHHIAFIFQSFHLLEDYSALENVLMPARIARKEISKKSLAYIRACALLDQVGLKERMHFHTKLLSGGERQRVAIARALCNDPDVILADEPSGNLDKETAGIIHDLLLGFAKKANKSVIIVTHDPQLANLCDKNYVLFNGSLIPKTT